MSKYKTPYLMLSVELRLLNKYCNKVNVPKSRLLLELQKKNKYTKVSRIGK